MYALPKRLRYRIVLFPNIGRQPSTPEYFCPAVPPLHPKLSSGRTISSIASPLPIRTFW